MHGTYIVLWLRFIFHKLLFMHGAKYLMHGDHWVLYNQFIALGLWINWVFPNLILKNLQNLKKIICKKDYSNLLSFV